MGNCMGECKGVRGVSKPAVNEAQRSFPRCGRAGSPALTLSPGAQTTVSTRLIVDQRSFATARCGFATMDEGSCSALERDGLCDIASWL